MTDDLMKLEELAKAATVKEQSLSPEDVRKIAEAVAKELQKPKTGYEHYEGWWVDVD